MNAGVRLLGRRALPVVLALAIMPGLSAAATGRAASPDPGAGYLLVSKAGNVYAFHTPFYGSKAGHTLPAPIVGIAAAR